MKKLLGVAFATLCLSHAAFADSAANLRINISGAATDNTYFLCVPGVGCLSILAGDKGKVYPVYQPIDLQQLFVTNVDHNFKVTAQEQPSSCNTTVQTNQSVTISGHITPLANGNIELSGLHCSVSKS